MLRWQRYGSRLLLRQRQRSSYDSPFLKPTALRCWSSSNASDSDNDDETVTVVKDNTNNSTPALGESAPRLPHTIGLPVVSRPLFPGIVTSVTLTDGPTIAALEQLLNTNNSGSASGSDSNETETNAQQTQNTQQQQPYVSCFLRKHRPTGVSEGGVILPTPEVITDPADIYSVGTFVKVQSLTRGNSSTSGGNHATSATGLHTPPGNDTNDDIANEESATAILLAHRRVNLTRVDDVGPPLQVTVEHWNPPNHNTNVSNQELTDTVRALSNEIIATIREVARVNVLFRENLQYFPMRIDANDPYRLADFAASIIASATPADLQAILEQADPEQRLHQALQLLHKERHVSQLQQEISQNVEESMSQAQRKYFLTEQLKSIKKELGMERDDKEALLEKYELRLAEIDKENANVDPIPEEARTTIRAELEKFATLEKNSPEYNVTRSYLDWLILHLPWGKNTVDQLDLRKARRILNAQHYGMQDVKDTILQFIAVEKLRRNNNNNENSSKDGDDLKDDPDTATSSSSRPAASKILCLGGPPGTGKTSIAQSIAASLGREFFRFSVGGLSDVSEIKGHRRTYIGAMPGKLIQCLKTTGTNNPVVLIDEIDKLGAGYRGDPASALLEVLDPGQNSTFRDYFLDVPVDLSKILFICTANELERIPGPLLDRMEVMRLSGYDLPEKVAIAEQYLVPKSMRNSGLMYDPEDMMKAETKPGDDNPQEAGDVTAEENGNPEDEIREGTPLDHYKYSKGVPESVQLTKGAITSLARWYAREAGVRNLNKYIDKITRKLALQVVAEDEGATLTDKSMRKSDTWEVSEDNLADYVGKPVFTSDRLYEDGPLPHGIVMGLAYTSMGGSALYIETQRVTRGLDADGKQRGGGTLKVTGQLGDVMKESSQIAYTVARARLSNSHPDVDFFDVNDMHMHVPEGATPKDGPSAGVTMVTSLLSLAMDRPIRNDLAMTGEISLTGKVLAVGGIKEKIMAARRAGITCVILPSANQRDFDEIPNYLQEDLEVHYADSYDTVFDVAFGSS